MTIAIYIVAGLSAIAAANILWRMPRAASYHPVEDYLLWSFALIGSCVAMYYVSWWPCGSALAIGLILAFVKAFRKALRNRPGAEPPRSYRPDGFHHSS